MEVNVTRIHEDFTEAKDDFRDGFRPWCEKEVDVMTVIGDYTREDEGWDEVAGF